MMGDDCLAVSCVAPSVSSSYSTEPVSAVTAKRVLMNETASSLQSFRSVHQRDNCSQRPGSRRGQRAHEYH